MPGETGYLPASEDEIIACIGRHFRNQGPGVIIGRGDDCAVLDPGRKLCVSTDLFCEDFHFRTAYFRPDDIGYKALAVNISDLAAMGAKPTGFTLALGLPAWVSPDWLDDFFHGMAEAAEQHGMILLGGDLSRSERIQIAITALGEKQETSSLLLRGGAMPGDIIFLVGNIGLARIGLQELERSGREALAQWPDASRAHLRPVPQVAAGLMLGRAGFNARPPVLLDISDGLASDLPRLLQNGSLGASIELSEAMLHPEVVRHALESGGDAVVEAYLGGEDYALLGACAPDMAQALHSAIPGFCRLGTITSERRICCNGQDMGNIRGFDHFA